MKLDPLLDTFQVSNVYPRTGDIVTLTHPHGEIIYVVTNNHNILVLHSTLTYSQAELTKQTPFMQAFYKDFMPDNQKFFDFRDLFQNYFQHNSILQITSSPTQLKTIFQPE